VHSLRHSYGTELAARGVPLPVIQRLMGHADVRTTMRYITVGESQLRDAVSSAFGTRGGGVAADRKKRRK
jgi:integrase/recombinase XerD